MHKITIITNENLYKLLGQAGQYLPGCGIYHAEILNSDILKDSMCVIADNEGFNSIKPGGKAKLIALCASGEEPLSPDISMVRKPLRITEIIDLLQGILAKNEAINDIIEIGGFIFDLQLRTLTKNQAKITLTEKESDLLLLLYKAGAEVSQEEILKDVWGYEADIDTHTVQTHIYRIRQKLGKDNDFIGSSTAGYFIKQEL